MLNEQTVKLLVYSLGAFLFIWVKLQLYHRAEMTSAIVGLDFEVYGRVQGVFFRKYTRERSEELGLKGWCMNTARGTVVGRIEGDRTKIEEMKRWLQYTGSPRSTIEKTEFRNEKELSKSAFLDFKIRK